VVKTVAAQTGKSSPAIDQTVALVDGWLVKNRSAGVAKAG
jgi:hypothetical protein